MKRFKFLFVILCLLLVPTMTMGAYPTITAHSKLYPKTSVLASPYSCDNTGTLDCSAAIEQIKANQANIGTIYFPHGTYRISSNLTIPNTMCIEREAGAVISVDAGKVLTINARVIGCSGQLFSGSGSIVFGPDYTGCEIIDTWFPTLAKAVASIGANNHTLRVCSCWSITSDLEIPDNVTTKIENGAILSITDGITLTINGPLSAGFYQIFDDNNTDLNGVSFGDGSVKEAYPQWWGAKGDGATDDAEAFQLALNAASKIYIPKGHYVLNSSLVGEKDCTIRGESRSQTILDFSTVVGDDYYLMLFSGTKTQISDLAANHSKDDVLITFATAHGLEVGDIFFIYNNEDYSFSAWRDYYRQGEIHRVGEVVSSTEINLDEERLYADYDIVSDNVDVFKMHPIHVEMYDLSFWTNPNKGGVYFLYCANSEAKNLAFYGGCRASLHVMEGYSIRVDNINVDQYNIEPDTATGYGVAVSSSQDVVVSNCNVHAYGHGFTTSNSLYETFPIRNLSVENVTCTHTALACHGLCEFVTLNNCYAPAGITIAGNHGKIQSCWAGKYVTIWEPRGFDFVIENNYFISNQEAGGAYNYFLRTSEPTDSELYEGGTIKIWNNYINTKGYSDIIRLSLKDVYSHAIGVIIEDNKISNGTIKIRCDEPDGQWAKIRIANNVLHKVRVYMNPFKTKTMDIVGNTFYESPEIKILSDSFSGDCSWTQLVDFSCNRIYSPQNYIHIGLSPNVDSLLRFESNIVLDSDPDNPSMTSEKTNVRIDYPKTVVFRDNILGYTESPADDLLYNLTILCHSNVVNFYMNNNNFVGCPLGVKPYDSTNLHILEGSPYKGNKTMYASAAPTAGTWSLGDRIYDSSPSAGGSLGWVCTSAGTFSTATDNTGDTDGSTAIITGMTDTSDFNIGDYVDVSNGFPVGTVRIVDIISATSIRVNVNSDSAQNNITVSTPDPVFKTFGSITS